MAFLNIVLLEPEIAENTGNIGRTCVATGAALHLIEPLGFRLTSKQVARAGMDYWPEVDLHRYSSFESFLEKNPAAAMQADGTAPNIFMATTKAEHTYADVKYPEGCYIMFGKESAGIPEEILMKYREQCIRIPMIGEIRSLNLSNSAAIIAYEALRQHNFEHMKKQGQLHHHQWSELDQ